MFRGCWPFKDDAAGPADVGRADRRCARPPAAAAPHHGLRTAEDQATTQRPGPSRSGDGRQAEAAAPVEERRAARRPGLLHASVQSQVQLSDKEGCEPGRLRRRSRNHEPGLFRQPVGPAGAEPLGARNDLAALYRWVQRGDGRCWPGEAAPPAAALVRAAARPF